jgi:hypothetical protein
VPVAVRRRRSAPVLHWWEGGAAVTAGDDDFQSDPKASLNYSRRLYSNVVDWYKNAETKAQILLSLDGIFVSVLVGSLLRDPATMNPILNQSGTRRG